LIFGLLTYVQSKSNWASALLASLAAAGAALVAMHQLLIT
jgi:hypothetical protein